MSMETIKRKYTTTTSKRAEQNRSAQKTFRSRQQETLRELMEKAARVEELEAIVFTMKSSLLNLQAQAIDSRNTIIDLLKQKQDNVEQMDKLYADNSLLRRRQKSSSKLGPRQMNAPIFTSLDTSFTSTKSANNYPGFPSWTPSNTNHAKIIDNSNPYHLSLSYCHSNSSDRIPMIKSLTEIHRPTDQSQIHHQSQIHRPTDQSQVHHQSQAHRPTDQSQIHRPTNIQVHPIFSDFIPPIFDYSGFNDIFLPASQLEAGLCHHIPFPYTPFDISLLERSNSISSSFLPT